MINYCLNLPERVDRWNTVEPELKKLGIPFMRVDAVKDSPGFIGCRKSHLALLDQLHWENKFMISEDDLMLLPDAKQTLERAFDQIPKDWDMLYLGATLNIPLEKHSYNLYKLRKGYTTHAIIYNNQHNVVDFILNNCGSIRKIDVFFADEVQERFKCFITWPMVATQAPGYSDIMNRHTDGDVILKLFKAYTKDYDSNLLEG